MSFWYDIKNKNYASNEKTSWFRAYIDRIAATIRGESARTLSDHLAGADDRHTAATIKCSDGKTVQSTLDADAAAIAQKVDKVSGKGLSTNDYDAAEKAEVAKVKNKVDKIAGKGLSANDYTTADKTEVAKIKDKVDKITGKGLSANDYTAADKAEVAKIKDKVDKIDGKGLSTNDFTDAAKSVTDVMEFDSAENIINSTANLSFLEGGGTISAYTGRFRGELKIGQMGENKWVFQISPSTGLSTSSDIMCTVGNTVHNLAKKANTSEVITKTNTTQFTPTGDYQPATKKYIDDIISELKLQLGLD